MVERVIYLALPLVGTLAGTLSPPLPVSLGHERVSPPPLARLEPGFVASKIAIGPLRGPGSDPRTPSSATPPPCHLPQLPLRVAPLPFDPCALIARSTISVEPGGCREVVNDLKVRRKLSVDRSSVEH